jgi:hypothetical protein
MRREVDVMLAGQPHEWEIVDVDTDPDLLLRHGDSIPVLFVNGRLFAKIRLPRFSSRVRLLKATSATL